MARAKSPSMISVMAVKEAVNRAYEVPLSEGLLFERVFHSLFTTEDQKEGMSAFLETRGAIPRSVKFDCSNTSQDGLRL